MIHVPAIADLGLMEKETIEKIAELKLELIALNVSEAKIKAALWATAALAILAALVLMP